MGHRRFLDWWNMYIRCVVDGRGQCSVSCRRGRKLGVKKIKHENEGRHGEVVLEALVAALETIDVGEYIYVIPWRTQLLHAATLACKCFTDLLFERSGYEGTAVYARLTFF